jgi:hypothetical protein
MNYLTEKASNNYWTLATPLNVKLQTIMKVIVENLIIEVKFDLYVGWELTTDSYSRDFFFIHIFSIILEVVRNR